MLWSDCCRPCIKVEEHDLASLQIYFFNFDINWSLSYCNSCGGYELILKVLIVGGSSYVDSGTFFLASNTTFPPKTTFLSLDRWYWPQFQFAIIIDLLVRTRRREHRQSSPNIAVHRAFAETFQSSSNWWNRVVFLENLQHGASLLLSSN